LSGLGGGIFGFCIAALDAFMTTHKSTHIDITANNPFNIPCFKHFEAVYGPYAYFESPALYSFSEDEIKTAENFVISLKNSTCGEEIVCTDDENLDGNLNMNPACNVLESKLFESQGSDDSTELLIWRAVAQFKLLF
jgi:hypothetical protein